MQTVNYHCQTKYFIFCEHFLMPWKTLPVNEFRSRECRKLHFRESNFKNFPGNMPPDPHRSLCIQHSMFAPLALQSEVRPFNLWIQSFKMLPKTLEKLTNATLYNNTFKFALWFVSSEQHKQSEEKLQTFTSEKEESQLRVLTLIKERDEFATLALERGKALEVSHLSTISPQNKHLGTFFNSLDQPKSATWHIMP